MSRSVSPGVLVRLRVLKDLVSPVSLDQMRRLSLNLPLELLFLSLIFESVSVGALMSVVCPLFVSLAFLLPSQEEKEGLSASLCLLYEGGGIDKVTINDVEPYGRRLSEMVAHTQLISYAERNMCCDVRGQTIAQAPRLHCRGILFNHLKHLKGERERERERERGH